MTDMTRRSLPPMGAIEFSIAAVFRHFFFGLRLALGWLVVLLPLLALAWYMVLRNGPPDIKALSGGQIAAIAALGVGVLLASFSIAVNWHRRLLLDEKPRRLRWVRLDGVVWRYLAGFVLLLLVLALYGGAAYGLVTMAPQALELKLGPAAKPLGIVLAVLFGLSALFTFYRLSSWLAGIAAGDRGYTLGTAWKATAKNRFAYLGFTFWLLFTLAIAGAIGAGAFFAQQTLPQPWVKPAAFAVMGVLAWLAMFLITSVASGHYRCFAAQEEPGPGRQPLS